MVKAALLALVFATAGSSAFAMPIMVPGPHPSALSDNVVDVKIVCLEDGQCFRPPARRPVATWVYGDQVFFGPAYAGPGYYGAPGSHWRWLPLVRCRFTPSLFC